VGKTSLCWMFQSQGKMFPKNYKLTAGSELVVGSVTVPKTTTVVEQYLHDTGGQEVFADLAPKYWNDISIVMLVYDITREETFDSLGKWLDLVKGRRSSKGRKLQGVVVGNKKDLEARRQVPASRGEEWARGQGLDFCEVSAMPPLMKDYDKGFVLIAESFHRLYESKLEEIQSCFQG